MKRNPEAGYILLFVYAMAATIAIMLYMVVPRAAFEAQRDREQLLIDRGEQYSRAITLYVRKFNKYPADFDALNNTQNLRFLRKRYVDPMTGKDDWRIIHVGPGGVFTDSLIYGKKKTDDQKKEAQNFITELQQTGGNQNNGPQNVNLAARQRASDQAGAPGDVTNPQAGAPGGMPPPPPQIGIDGKPILPAPANNNGGGLVGTTTVGVMNGQQVSQVLPPDIQLPPGVSFPQGFQAPNTNNNNSGLPQTGTGANMINQILTTPRPGGLAGLPDQQGANGLTATAPPQFSDATAMKATNTATPTANGAATSQPTSTAQTAAIGQTIGGGIGGIASKREQEGIKKYADHQKYNEWEFVYDVTKDPSKGGGQTIPPPPNPGQTGPGGTGSPGSTAGSGQAAGSSATTAPLPPSQ